MEYWDLYNRKGKFKNRVIRRGVPFRKSDYHMISEGWILRDDEKFIIQRRALNKSSFAGMWYCSAGGSVIAGEDPKDAMQREFCEELSLKIPIEEIRLKRIITENNAIFNIYLVRKNIELEDIVLQEEEVCDVKLATCEEIFEMIDEGIFIALDYYNDFFEKTLGRKF